MSKVIQIDIKKQHLKLLQKASTTLEVKLDEDTKKQMERNEKKKQFQKKVEENRINPNVFLMNSKLKTDDNAHIFEMDFSEFVLPRKKNDEHQSFKKSNIKQSQPTFQESNTEQCQKYQIKKEQHNIGQTRVKHQIRQQNEIETLTSLLDNIDNIDNPVFSNNSNNFNKSDNNNPYNNNSNNHNINSDSSKLFRKENLEQQSTGASIGYKSIKSNKVPEHVRNLSNSVSKCKFEKNPDRQNLKSKNRFGFEHDFEKSSFKEVRKSTGINSDFVGSFPQQGKEKSFRNNFEIENRKKPITNPPIIQGPTHTPLKSIENPQPLNKPNHIVFEKEKYNKVASKLLNLNQSTIMTLKRPKRQKHKPLNLNLLHTNNTNYNNNNNTATSSHQHVMPDDPIFQNTYDPSFKIPKMLSPKYIAPPKGNLDNLPSPTSIPFPYETDPDVHSIDIGDIKPLPKGTGSGSSISKNVNTKLRQPSRQPKKKMSQHNTLYTILSRKNKIPNTVKDPKKAPRKLMKDIYRFSKPFKITFENKY
jgi:hypothetical protein